MLFMVMVTHVHVGVNFASLGLICGSGRELPYSLHHSPERLWSGHTVSRSPDDGSMMLRLKNLSFTECDCYLGDAPGPSFVL